MVSIGDCEDYEALSNEISPIFFLKKVKCNVIAKNIGVDKGDVVLKAKQT